MRSFTRRLIHCFISRQALRKSVARLAQEMGSRCSRTEATCSSPAADLLFSTSRPVLSAFAMEVELNLGKLKTAIVRFGQSVEASDVMTSGEIRRSHRLFPDKRARDIKECASPKKLRGVTPTNP